MPIYYFTMAAYNIMTLFIVIVLFYNMFKSKSVWEQLTAFLVICPFLFRVLLIK